MNNIYETTVKIWEEIDINTPIRMQYLEDINNKINNENIIK